MRPVYSLSQLQAMIDLYPQAGVIENHSLFTSGFENSNFFIQVPAGKFVIKIFEGQDLTLNIIRSEIDVIIFCRKHGLRVPQIFPNLQGDLVSTYEKKHLVLMELIPGQNMEMKQIPDGVAVAAGTEMGKMDTILSTYTGQCLTRQDYPWDMKHFHQLGKKLSFLTGEFDQHIFHHIFDEFSQIAGIFMDCPSGLIHNDVGLHNMLVDGETLRAIIDFSDMAVSPYVQNVAVTLCQMFFAYNWEPRQARLFLDAYIQYHPLGQEECSLLYTLTCARYATYIIELSYWNHTFGPDEHRSKTIHDYYAFLQRFLMIRTEFAHLVHA